LNERKGYISNKIGKYKARKEEENKIKLDKWKVRNGKLMMVQVLAFL
jgi:hypothetical protein